MKKDTKLGGLKFRKVSFYSYSYFSSASTASNKQLQILNQGVETWNKWRQGNPLEPINLHRSQLDGAILDGINLRDANLSGIYLREASLRKADLRKAYLGPDSDHVQAHLGGADLRDCILTFAILEDADLSGANLESSYIAQANLRGAFLEGVCLRGAKLNWSDLFNSDLSSADLENSDLSHTNLTDSLLTEAKIFSAKLYGTIFGETDLSGVKGLESCNHDGPSIIDYQTINKSDNIPASFLRGCGFPEWLIESYKLRKPDLSNSEIKKITSRIHDIRVDQPVQIHNLFISYSHDDHIFVDQLERHLNKRGIRFWRDLHDSTAGPLEKVVNRALRQNPTVLLIFRRNL